MQGEPAEPSPEDPAEISEQLRQQVTRLKRWFAWERWLMEPRSFSPPEESVREESNRDEEFDA